MADLDVIEPIPRLDPIVAIGKDELVEGGLEGVANRPIIALANQVAYVMDRTYSKTDVDDLAANLEEMISAAEKGVLFFETAAELLATNQGTENRTAQARDTSKVYLWKIKSAAGVTPVVWGWVDTGLSDLDKSKDFISKNSFARVESLAQEVNINYTTSDRNLLIQGTVRIISNTDKYTLATPQNIPLPLDTPYRLEYVIETGLIQAVSWLADRTNGSLVLGFVVASSTSFRTNDFKYSIDGIAVIGASKNDITALNNSLDSLRVNSGKDFPLKQLTRNGITSASSDINTPLLNIEVLGAKKGKLYKLEYFANGLVDATNAIHKDSWRFTEYDESTFPSTIGTAGGVTVITSSMPQVTVDRTVTDTYLIVSTTHDVKFKVTIKGDALKASGSSYNLMSSSYTGWSFVIDKSCYVYADETILNDINELKSATAKPIFPSNSPILSAAYIGKDAIELVEFWGLEDDESVYLRTFWNYFFNTYESKYYSSIGFNSSKNQHIAIGLAPQANISLYSMFEVTEKLTETVEYLLYRNGDASTEPVGRVRVNWSKVINSTTARFIKTDNSNPLIMPNVVNKASQQVLQIAKAITPESPFFGKKIGAIGDSITWGFTPRNDPNGGTTGAQLNSWLILSAEKLGMTAFNYGISGSTLGANSAGANAPFSRRYQNMANDLDVICVMGGTNDVRKSVPLGTMADRVDTTYYGALHVICQGLIDKYYINQGTELGKSKQIVLMTPIKLQVGGGTALDTSIEPYVQAVKDVGAYYSIPVLDMYNLSGITPHISQTIQGTETGYTKTYNVYITDGTHPTQQGHEKMAAAFSGFLKTLF